MNLKSYILRDLFICSYDEIKFAHCILFYFIFLLYNIWFIDYDLLHSYLYILFHLVSIVWKKETWIYILEKNIVINKVYIVRTWSNSSHTAIFFFIRKLLHCIFIHISLYIILNYKINLICKLLHHRKTSNIKHNFK